jgi:prepilin-type N-terminal cleavage/methylation domain-containing protein
MLKKIDKKGFTIIEVLIVLAIAGLILLVVFLAVPALQRNQRNTGRRNDAARIAAAVNDYVSNSNGTTPTNANLSTIANSAGTLSNLGTLTPATGNVAACGAGGAMNASGNGAYNFKVCTGATTGAFTATGDAVMIATGAQCNGADQTSAGSSRQIAVLYTQEQGGTAYTVACQNL